MSEASQIPATGLALIEEIIRSQPHFESAVTGTSMIPALIVLCLFTASLYLLWLSTRFLKDLRLFTAGCLSLTVTGVFLFQGCSRGAGDLNSLDPDDGTFIKTQAGGLFVTAGQHSQELRITVPTYAGALISTHRASLQTGAYFSYEGDSEGATPSKCMIPNFSLPVSITDYKVQAESLIVNPLSMADRRSQCLIFRFSSGFSISVAIFNELGALATRVQRVTSQITDIQEYRRAALALMNDSKIPGLRLSRESNGRWSLSSSAYPESVTLTQVTSSTLGLVQLSESVSYVEEPPQMVSSGQAAAFEKEILEATDPNPKLSTQEPSLDSSLGMTKWEIYIGRPSYYTLATRLLFWASSDIGGVENFDVNPPQLPDLSRHPTDILSVSFAKLLPIFSAQGTANSRYGTGVLLNTANLSDPLYTQNIYARDLRSSGDVAAEILSFHRLGLKTRLASKGAIIDGQSLTQRIERRHSPFPQGSIDINMPSANDGGVSTSNKYRGLFSFPSVELAFQAKESFRSAFKKIAGDNLNENTLMRAMTTYLETLGRGCGDSEEKFAEARHSLSPACQPDRDDPYNPELLDCSEGRMETFHRMTVCERPTGMPEANAFPWMRFQDLMYVDAHPDGSAVLMVNTESQLEMPGINTLKTYPYTWFVILALASDELKLFSPETESLGTTLIVDFPEIINLSQETSFTSYFEKLRELLVKFHFHQEPRPAVYRKAAAGLSEQTLNRKTSPQVLGGLDRVNLSWPSGLADVNQFTSVSSDERGDWGLGIFKRKLVESCGWNQMVQSTPHYIAFPGMIETHAQFELGSAIKRGEDVGLRCFTPPRAEVVPQLPYSSIDYNGENINGLSHFHSCALKGVLNTSDNFPPLTVQVPQHPSKLACGVGGQDFIGVTLPPGSGVSQEYSCTCVESGTDRTVDCNVTLNVPATDVLTQNEWSVMFERKEQPVACYGKNRVGGWQPCCGDPGADPSMPCRDDCEHKTCNLVTNQEGNAEVTCSRDYCEAPWMEKGQIIRKKDDGSPCEEGESCRCVGSECCGRSYPDQPGYPWHIYCEDYWDCRKRNANSVYGYMKSVLAKSSIIQSGRSRVEAWGVGRGGSSKNCTNLCDQTFPDVFHPFDDNWKYFLKRQGEQPGQGGPWNETFSDLNIEPFRFSTPSQVWSLRRSRLDATSTSGRQDWINQQTVRRYLDLMVNYLEQSRTNPPLPLPVSNSATPVIRKNLYFNSNQFVQNEIDWIERERREKSERIYGREFNIQPGQKFTGGITKEEWSKYYGRNGPNVDTFNVINNRPQEQKVGYRAERDLPIADDPEFFGGQKSLPPRRHTLEGHRQEIFGFKVGRPQKQRSFFSLGADYTPLRDQFWREPQADSSSGQVRYHDPMEDVLPLWFMIESGIGEIWMETDPLMVNPQAGGCDFDLYAMEWEHRGQKTGLFENQLVYKISKDQESKSAIVPTKLARRNKITGRGYLENLLTPENHKRQIPRPAGFGLLGGTRKNLEQAELKMKLLREEAVASRGAQPPPFFIATRFSNPYKLLLSQQPRFECTTNQMRDINYACYEPARWRSRSDIELQLRDFRIDWPPTEGEVENPVNEFVFEQGEFAKIDDDGVNLGCGGDGLNIDGNYSVNLPVLRQAGWNPKQGFPSAYCIFKPDGDPECTGGVEYQDRQGNINPQCEICSVDRFHKEIGDPIDP